METDEQGTISRRGLVQAAAGAAVAAGATTSASGVAGAQEDDGDDGGGGQTVTVEMTDGLNFEPGEVSVTPGTTVVWENTGSIGHSVTAYEANIPDDAEYWASGGFDSESAAREAYTAGDPDSGDVAGGETYEHTFETLGTHEYFCIPHEGAGMVGSVVVEEADQGGGGSEIPRLPESAKTLMIATLAAMGSTLILAYVFLKHGGGTPESA